MISLNGAIKCCHLPVLGLDMMKKILDAADFDGVSNTLLGLSIHCDISTHYCLNTRTIFSMVEEEKCCWPGRRKVVYTIQPLRELSKHKTNTLIAPQFLTVYISLPKSVRFHFNRQTVRTGYKVILLLWFWNRVSAEVLPQISPSRMARFVALPSYLSQEGNRTQIPAPPPLAYWRGRFVGSATSATDQIRD